MKILHTADWHLGKQLCSKSRLSEQEQVLAEITDIVIQQNVDVVLVCGDIFDTSVPKAEGEQVFFKHVLNISRHAIVVCFSGNHDDGERLNAPSPLGATNGIFLIGAMDNTGINYVGGNTSVTGGDGYLRINKNGESVCLAILPYPYSVKMLQQAQGDTNKERVRGLIDRCTAGFSDSSVNIFASHLFVSASSADDERELGTAPLTDRDELPKCSYVALGHIHKPQSLSTKDKIHYSGSPLKYSFDDKGSRCVKLYDTVLDSVSSIELSSGLDLLTFEVSDIESAYSACADNENSYVKLIYSGSPLTAIDMKRLKGTASFTDIRIVVKEQNVRQAFAADRPINEVFADFYKSVFDESPDKDMTELFLDLIGGEHEAD